MASLFSMTRVNINGDSTIIFQGRQLLQRTLVCKSIQKQGLLALREKNQPPKRSELSILNKEAGKYFMSCVISLEGVQNPLNPL